MIANKHEIQKHHLHYIEIVVLVILIALAVTYIKEITVSIITLFVLAYFIANVIHAHVKHQLTIIRVIELGLLTAIFEFLFLTYLT